MCLWGNKNLTHRMKTVETDQSSLHVDEALNSKLKILAVMLLAITLHGAQRGLWSPSVGKKATCYVAVGWA